MRAFSRVFGMLALAALMASAGCLRKESTHTIYISPGGVTWSALEMDVRSDQPDAAKRFTEEHDFVLAANAGRHPAAAALTALAGRQITTTWLRRDRPYTLVTEGRFTDLREVTLALLHDNGIEGSAAQTRNGCRSRFTARVNVESGSSEGTPASSALYDELVRYRLVLTEGRFESADGFTIEEDGTVARPDQDKEPVDGILTLALTWIEDGCA